MHAGRLHGAEPPETGRHQGETAAGTGVDVKGGHKTGFYLDQRDNRALRRRLCPWCRHAQLLCLHRRVCRGRPQGRAPPMWSMSMPRRRPLELAAANVKLNGLDSGRVDFEPGDVFEWLRPLPQPRPDLRPDRARPAQIRQIQGAI